MKKSSLKKIIKECYKIILEEVDSAKTESDEIVRTSLGEYYIGDLRDVASNWHSGQTSAFYAFSSSGTIVFGLEKEANQNIKYLENADDNVINNLNLEDGVSVEIDKLKAIGELENRLKTDEEELDETSTTGGVAGYQTPFAFSKKTQKKTAEQLGYKIVNKPENKNNK